jgi:hypothetical protein
VGERGGGGEPSMSVLGKRGLSATRRPPKPQPMSAISTCFIMRGSEPGVRDAEAWVCVSTKAGKCFDQFISEGLAGLYSAIC